MAVGRAWETPELAHTHAFFKCMPISDRATIQQYIDRFGPNIVNFQDADGWTPLIHATRYSDAETVALLIDNGADINKSDGKEGPPIYHAASRWRIGIVQTLLQKGALLDACEKGSEPPLARAIERSDGKMVEMMLEHGANIELANDRGLTPLMTAVTHDDAAITDMLLEYGANLHTACPKGRTARSFAEARGNDEVVAVIQKHLRRQERLAFLNNNRPRVTFRRKV